MSKVIVIEVPEAILKERLDLKYGTAYRTMDTEKLYKELRLFEVRVKPILEAYSDRLLRLSGLQEIEKNWIIIMDSIDELLRKLKIPVPSRLD